MSILKLLLRHLFWREVRLAYHKRDGYKHYRRRW